MKKLVLLVPAAALFIACTSQSVNKGTSTNTSVVANSENMAQGKMLFESNCARCHDLPTVTKYTDEKWKSLVAWMAPKAKLNAEQTDLVYLYVSNSN